MFAGVMPRFVLASAAVVAPVLGWLLAKRIAESSAKDMRVRWEGLLSGSGVIANSKGALVGDATTPIEMGRIEDGLVLY